jgi:hypothetical protein
LLAAAFLITHKLMQYHFPENEMLKIIIKTNRCLVYTSSLHACLKFWLQIAIIGKYLAEYALCNVEADASLLTSVTDCLTKTVQLLNAHFKESVKDFYKFFGKSLASFKSFLLSTIF